MNEKRFDEFVRFLRAFCKEVRIELREETKSGPHTAFTLFCKEGSNKVTFQRFVVRSDKKLLSQRALRRLVAQCRAKSERSGLRDPNHQEHEVSLKLTKQLERWAAN